MNGCAHVDPRTVMQEFTLMSEGACPGCAGPCSRTPDGFMRCGCCEVEWRLSGYEVTFRLPMEKTGDG